MYRDFVGVDPDAARAGDEPRARDRGSAADGPDLRRGRADHVIEHFDIVIIGSGAGGGTMAHALAEHRRAHPDPRARRLRAAGRRELESRRGLEGPALSDDGALARRARPRVPSVHALQRRRQHQVLGQRALPAAARGLPGASSTRTACRRPGRSTTTRWRRIYDRAERLYHVHGQHGVDPTEPPRGPFPYPPVPHAPAMAEIVEQLRAQGLHPSPLPLGLLRPGEADGCILCNTCNSFPCRHPREERRRRLRRAAGDRAPERDALDQCLRAPADHRRQRAEASRRSRSSGTARRSGSTRRCSSCRAAP